MLTVSTINVFALPESYLYKIMNTLAAQRPFALSIKELSTALTYKKTKNSRLFCLVT